MRASACFVGVPLSVAVLLELRSVGLRRDCGPLRWSPRGANSWRGKVRGTSRSLERHPLVVLSLKRHRPVRSFANQIANQLRNTA